MGKVLVVFRILPEEVGIEQKIKEKIMQEKKFQVKDVQEEEIAFGLKALKIGVLLEDSEGHKTGEIEKMLSNIEGVRQAEMESSTLI